MNYSSYSSSTTHRHQSKFNWSSMGGGNTAPGESPLFAPGLNTGTSVLNESVKIRLAFLRKVYGILSAQLVLTTLISVAIIFSPGIQHFLFSNLWLVFGILIANIATTFGLMYKRNEYPTNFYLLGAFTLLNSISVGSIVSIYDLDVVIQAFFLTGAIVIGLTLYTFNSKNDFTWLSGILSSLIMVSLFGSILHIFAGNNFTYTMLTAFGAFIFSIYIIYDTQLIMKHLSAEEYIVGVINLYVDIVNLFIKILRLLDQLKSDESRQKDKRRR